MNKKISIWSLTLLTLFLFLITVLPKQGESSKSCFVGYSEYAIVNYDMRVSGTQYNNFLDQLAAYDLNFVNIWPMGYCNWEYNGQEGSGPPRNCPGFIELMPYKRSGSGGKYNLIDFDPAFFTRLKNFISYAASKGIVVEITLFDSWGLKHTGEWSWHPWDCNYNVNGRICGYGCGSFFDLTDSVLIDIQKKYTQKVVYETKSYNNVIYEIMNEPLLCGPSESQAKEWHKKVAEWIREAKPDAQIVINDNNKIISYFSNYNLISPHYGSWGDGSGTTWIPSLITSLSSYGKHIIIDDDGCIWANLRKNPSNQQAWSTAAINNGASYTHLQDDLYCDYFIIDTNVLNALKTAGQQCTSFPLTPPTGCSDGTSNAQCSATKPKYCSSGSLINNCSFCGCPSSQICQADGSCSGGGTGGVKIDQTWACGSGFPPCSSDTTGICNPVPQPYLKMSSNQYSFTFTAPTAANYTCTITATASYFDYQNTQQTNEKTDVYLNNKKVGTTADNWCPPGGISEPPPDPCGQYGDVYACNSVSGCDWRYGAPGCGTIDNCQEINNEWHCDLRVCYWTGSGTIPCKGLKAEGTAWQNPQTCSQWDGNQAVCNDYTQHKGLVCCYNAQSSKCLVDPCPTWYKTRVENGYNEWTTNRGLSPTQAEDVLEKHCEGVNSGYNDDYYVLRPAGLCQWDSGWGPSPDNFEFPCACASNFENTGRTDYLHGTRSGGDGGEDKLCNEACSSNAKCKSGYCKEVSGVKRCTDSHGVACNPAQNWCNDNCTRNCMASCTYDDQCVSNSCQSSKCKKCCGDGVCGPGSSGDDHEYSTTARYCKEDCCGDGICYILESQQNLCKKDCCLVSCHSQTTKSTCNNYNTNICKCVWNSVLFGGKCLDCGEICDDFDGDQSGCLNSKDNSGNTLCKWENSNCECSWSGY